MNKSGRKECEISCGKSGGIDEVPSDKRVIEAFSLSSPHNGTRQYYCYERSEKESYIQNDETGIKIPLHIENGVYVMDVDVLLEESAESAFGRQV